MSSIIAGVDEAGRGPLAGPVIAAAVILDPKRPIQGLKDSKLLTEKQREKLFTLIQENCLAYAVGSADHLEIDQINILQASLLAMRRAIEGLNIQPDQILIDGNRCPMLGTNSTANLSAIIKGDQLIPAISAASIIAKVTRDRLMYEYHQTFPDYGFAQHKGYATAQHLEAVRRLGPTSIHRRSFYPINEIS